MDSLILKKATNHDIPLIQQLANKIWQSYYPAIIGQQQVDYMLGKMYSTAALQNQMEEGQIFFIVQYENTAIGFVSMSEKDAGEYFLHKFYIETDKHGKGLGSAVFQMLLAQFPTMRVIRLQVNRFNIKPINFYFKMGFVIEKAADFDIGNGYFMNDYVMIWNSYEL